MSRYHRPADQARTILVDATILTVTIDAALTNLDIGLAGWPTSTPGASPPGTRPSEQCHHPDCTEERPCPVHDGSDVALTSVERDASQLDQARRDLEALTDALSTAATMIARAARIAHRWGLPGIDQTTVAARLRTIDAEFRAALAADIWCENCQTHGFKNPRLEGRTECDFCAGFRREYNRPAPKEVLDIHAYRRLSVQDITRVLDRIDPKWRKKLKRAGG